MGQRAKVKLALEYDLSCKFHLELETGSKESTGSSNLERFSGTDFIAYLQDDLWKDNQDDPFVELTFDSSEKESVQTLADVV